MSRTGTPLALIFLLLVGCALPRSVLDDTVGDSRPANLPELPTGPSLDVLVLGDWGTGGPGQRKLAQAAREVFRFDPPELVLTVGDNFYPDGVQGWDDPLWERVFESVYSGGFWDTVPFHPVLGNHDRHGNTLAQIQYSEISSRWEMPAMHYSFREALPGGDSVLFLAMDTGPWQGERNGSVAQLSWVDSILEGSSDRWVVSYGHHPLASVGWHPTDEHFQRRLLPLLTGRAAVYLAGHNHSLEFLPLDATLLQGVCGGGGGRDNPYRVYKDDRALAAFTNGGWCYLRIFPQVLAVELYDREGGLRYRHMIRAAKLGG